MAEDVDAALIAEQARRTGWLFCRALKEADYD